MRIQGDSYFDAVALGSSAGGLNALIAVLGELPGGFPAAVLVAHHRMPSRTAFLAGLLQKRTALRVREALEGERPIPGTVYLSPPGRHLEVGPHGALTVSREGRVSYVCPSVDLLFVSLAAHYGERCCAVVLTGTGRDGSEGVCAVRSRGGFVIAQDAATSHEFGMPCSAIETRKVDLVLPLHQIGFALRSLMLTYPSSAYRGSTVVPS